MLMMLAIYGTTSAILVANHNGVRTAARWLVWTNYYKARVMSEPDSTNGELKHTEWDGWGWAGDGYVGVSGFRSG